MAAYDYQSPIIDNAGLSNLASDMPDKIGSTSSGDIMNTVVNLAIVQGVIKGITDNAQSFVSSIATFNSGVDDALGTVDDFATTV